MIIPIDKKIRIRGTADCWQLEKAVKRKGQTEWQAYKYFPTFMGAVGAACEKEIRLHPANSLSEALQAVDRIAARYSKLLDDAIFQRLNGDTNSLWIWLCQLVLINVHRAHGRPPVLGLFGIAHGVFCLLLQLERPRKRLLLGHLPGLQISPSPVYTHSPRRSPQLHASNAGFS